MDNNDLMNDQYDPDFDTLSMLSDDSGYYYSIFYSSYKFYQIRQDLRIFGRFKTNHLTYIFQALAPA